MKKQTFQAGNDSYEVFVGEELCFRGGNHIVVCDGRRHWQMWNDGTRHFDCKCEAWGGEHTKGTLATDTLFGQISDAVMTGNEFSQSIL